MKIFKFTWTLVVASNSEKILLGNLLNGDESSNAELFVQKDSPSAAFAYNRGLSEASNEIIVFAHQDVFLPPGWTRCFSEVITTLTEMDPNWGVVGLFGVKSCGEGRGFVYSTGLSRFVGRPFKTPIQVRTLDELLLVVRKSSGLRFDERLPGFHLYGTDICLQAEKLNMRNYVIPCFALHNSVGVKWLPWSFWKAYLYLRKKWRERLPIRTPCTTIAYSCMPVAKYWAANITKRISLKNKPGIRHADPSSFYKVELANVVECNSNPNAITL